MLTGGAVHGNGKYVVERKNGEGIITGRTGGKGLCYTAGGVSLGDRGDEAGGGDIEITFKIF